MTRKKEKAKAKKRRGSKPGVPRGPYKSKLRISPDEKLRRDVILMVALDVPRDQIATLLKIEPAKLEAQFATELTSGLTLANFIIARNFFNWAANESDPRSINAAKFWLQTKANWRDYTVPQHTPTKPLDLPDVEEHTPKLGKKEQAALDAQRPDTTTDMGALMAIRLATGGDTVN